MRKTIAIYMLETLRDLDAPGVMWGDAELLDECAQRCVHTNLMESMPLQRHRRIFTALDRSPWFVKKYTKRHVWNGKSLRRVIVRSFWPPYRLIRAKIGTHVMNLVWTKNMPFSPHVGDRLLVHIDGFEGWDRHSAETVKWLPFSGCVIDKMGGPDHLYYLSRMLVGDV